ncbi:CvpA family protein [Paenibacillus turpanensis]|uniref:CvpA family protein n=1 Tax=Paenibacillus turpanensis TaxID=2689078 RepID=UPI00140C9A1D|nr:CvpA family protein [Paenibacillus turpanensis]
MNTVDALLAVFFAAAFIFGFRKGFIGQLVSALGSVLALLCAYFFHDDIQPWTLSFLPDLAAVPAFQPYAPIYTGLRLDHWIGNALSFALVFFAVKIALLLVGGLLELLAKAPGLRLANRSAGAGLALLEALIISWLVLHLLAFIPSESLQESLAFSKGADWLLTKLPTWFSFDYFFH